MAESQDLFTAAGVRCGTMTTDERCFRVNTSKRSECRTFIHATDMKRWLKMCGLTTVDPRRK